MTIDSLRRRIGDADHKHVLLLIIAGWARLYPYTADLLTLDLCRPPPTPPHPLLWRVHTPLRYSAWEAALAGHPDKAYVRFLLAGISKGFRIGFSRTVSLRSAPRNMRSALEHPEVVQAYLEGECKKGRMLGPFSAAERARLPPCHTNRFGVIPKGHNTGKWRLITDLSFPPGNSVNDGIDPDLCSLTYTSVEQVAEVVASYPPGALLAKIDVESAYRLVPVHPLDRPLQAVDWNGALYIDPMLPFGLRSAPKIFNALADGLEWYLRSRGVREVFHYLDDFLIVGPPASPVCAEGLALLDMACTSLGVPIAAHKREGPSTCLTFLGIEVDSIAGQLRLPECKLARLRTLLDEWGDRKACRRRDLESLIGMLNHAAKVVRSGRSFLRRMLDLLHGTPTNPFAPRFIRLNREFRSDLAWWRLFIEEWNGVSFLPPATSLPTQQLVSDASGSWGCGAWFGNSWFQLPWDEQSRGLSIMAKELLPIVLAGAIWGQFWTHNRVRCLCDNQAVVASLRSRTTRDQHCMHMLRTLAFVEARHAFCLHMEYINTKANHLADDLSRGKLVSFFSKVPDADPSPTPLPSQLVELLLDPSLDWTSPRWLQQFRDIFRRASLPLPGEHMTQQ